MIASPLETIARHKFTHDAARLLSLAHEHGAEGFVLGLPIMMAGHEDARAQASRAFARNINKLSLLPILLWDERLSTVVADDALRAGKANRQERRDLVDKLAATVILQRALDRLRFIAASA